MNVAGMVRPPFMNPKEDVITAYSDRESDSSIVFNRCITEGHLKPMVQKSSFDSLFNTRNDVIEK